MCFDMNMLVSMCSFRYDVRAMKARLVLQAEPLMQLFPLHSRSVIITA